MIYIIIIIIIIIELRALITLHSEEPLLSTNNSDNNDNDNEKKDCFNREGPLQKDTVELLRNTLDLSLYSAKDIVNPAHQPFMLHMDTQLDSKVINMILQSECIHIPVYKYDTMHDKSHRVVVGVLKTKVCLFFLCY